MKVIFSALSVLSHNMSNFKAVLRSKVHINLSVEIAKTHKYKKQSTQIKIYENISKLFDKYVLFISICMR